MGGTAPSANQMAKIKQILVVGQAMGQNKWPSTCQPTTTPPWNPCQTTLCLPTPSNPKRYPNQIQREWAQEAMSLGLYQDQEWRKPKGPKTPPYHGNKWRATHSWAVEANNHWAPQESECGYCITDRWGEGNHCLGRYPLPPPQNDMIWRGEPLYPRSCQEDHQRQLLSPYDEKNLHLLPATWWVFEQGRLMVRFWKRRHDEEKEWEIFFEWMMGKGIV